VRELTTLDGRLAIDLTNDFTLAKGDSFDILAFASLAGPGFDALALDGWACSSAGVDKWGLATAAQLSRSAEDRFLALTVRS
jgi:hypothetical protein